MANNRTALAALASFSLMTFPSFGGTVLGGVGDADIQARNDNNPPINVTGESTGQLLPGCAGSVGQDRCSVFPVQLPDFGAVSHPFTLASFVFNYEGKNSTVVGNVDVYGLGRRSTSEVLTGDYWTATSTVDSTDATLLAENVITANSSSFGLRSVSGSALVNYLNSQYAGGAGAGDYVFFRLSVDEAQVGGASRYLITSADAGTAETAPRLIYNEEFNAPSTSGRPFIWVRNSEKAAILEKISSQAWAQSVFSGMVNRVAGEVSDHQSNRDSFLRELPVLWDTNPPRYKTYPTYSEARNGSKNHFDAALDSAVLYYLTGDEKYARCAADILHNATQTILAVTPSSIVGNGGWIFSDATNGYGLLYEARIMGAQLPIVYDFLHGWLESNQVYDVDSASMVDFSFNDAQEVFRTYYELTRDRGDNQSNWSALMGSCMLHSLLALDDQTERDAALQVYLTTGSNRQASLDDDYRHYGEAGSVWPESLQYALAVGAIRSAHMVMIERYDPQLSLFESYPNFPLSLPRIRDFRYPGGAEQISFGDGKRGRQGEPFFEYEMIYRHAKDRGYGELKTLMGELINGGIADNGYDRSALRTYATLGKSSEPLQLLWQEPVVTEDPVSLELPRTDELPFAGITLQRNESPNGDANYGLMGFVGGAGFVHSHASGMSMELFGMGEVMGAKSGRDDTYQTILQRMYYRLFASNNTVIVNGASIGDGGWQDLEINTVNSVSMEPQPHEEAVSQNFSFTTSSFSDNKGDLAEATQQRTLAIVRTSDTSGFYVDLFRSDSTVTSRTATTLNGNVTNEYHDYIYRNIGDFNGELEVDGSPLSLVNQSNRFQNDVGTEWEQPGWRYFSNTQVSYPHQGDFFAQFKATPTGKSSIYMDLHMPTISDREVAKVDSPAIKDAPAPYDNRDAPTLVIRKIGEAWDEPFLSVFEPHFGASGGTVQSSSALRRNATVVGVKVESLVEGKQVTHYILSNPNDNQTYSDPASGLSFQGRFGIVADFGGGEYELYLGDGRALSYQGNSLTSRSGDTEASLKIRIGEEPVVTANDPVEVVTSVHNSPLVAHWPLDEGAGVQAANIAGTPYTATLENGASWGSDAVRETYVVFDGNDDRIATTFRYALANDDDFTWTWWANKADPAGTKSGSIMLGNRYGGSGAESYEFIKLTPSQGQFANTSSIGAIERSIYPSEISNNGWNHYAMVKSGTSFQWYVNGSPQGGPVTINYHETAPLPFFIGGDGDNTPNEHFKGAIDDVQLYRTALIQTEINKVLNGVPLFSQEVMAGWDFWSSNTAPLATVTGSGITATASASTASGNWNISEDSSSGRGSSGDATWGNFDGNEIPASAVTSGTGVNTTATNGETSAELTLTLTNHGPGDWDLSAFHMDVIAFRPNAPRTYQLEVVSGEITNGLVFTSAAGEIGSLSGNLSGNHDQHHNIDISLLSLADSTLEAGAAAVLRVTFFNGTGSGGGHHLFLDNVAVSGVLHARMSALQSWRLEHFGSSENSGAAADHFDANSDGESNFLEFATGQDPLAGTLVAMPLQLNGDLVELRYSQSEAALEDGVIFTVKWSDTLLPDSWSSAGVSDLADPENPGTSESNHRLATVPVGAEAKKFLRLEVGTP